MTKRLSKYTPELNEIAEANQVKCSRIKDKYGTAVETWLVAFGPTSQKLIDAVTALAAAKPQVQTLPSKVEESKGPLKAEPKPVKKSDGELDLQKMSNQLIKLVEKKIILEK